MKRRRRSTVNATVIEMSILNPNLINVQNLISNAVPLVASTESKPYSSR